MRKLALALLALLLAGCTSMNTVRGPMTGKTYHLDLLGSSFPTKFPEAYYDECREAFPRIHPELPPAARAAISEKRVLVGMTKQELVVSWGPPGRIRAKIQYEFGSADVWEYPGFWVWLRNEQVVTIQEISDHPIKP